MRFSLIVMTGTCFLHLRSFACNLYSFFSFERIIASFILVLFMWINSGNLSPYTTNIGGVVLRLVGGCSYMFNCDHGQFVAVYDFLTGAGVDTWSFSVVLRRILFPILSIPFIKTMGFEMGSVLAGMIFNAFAFWIFVKFMDKRFSSTVSRITMWLLVFYPGIMYWAGTPYSYTAIVPCVLLSTILLFIINDTKENRNILLASFLLGILFLGYDLFIFYLPALIFLLLKKQKWLLIIPTSLLMLAPLVMVTSYIKYRYGISPENANTEIYKIMVKSYFEIIHHITDFNWLSAWLKYVFIEQDFFLVLIKNFFYSNFYFLPSLFLMSYILGRLIYKVKFNLIELSLLLSTILLFIFNNFAPRHVGFHMGGVWMARIYQPIFVVYILYIARLFDCINNHSFENKKYLKFKYFLFAIFGLCLGLNTLVITAPLLKNKYGTMVYHNFYIKVGKTNEQFINDLNVHGRYPLGICGKKNR